MAERLAAMPVPRRAAEALALHDGAFGLLGGAASCASLARSVHPDPALRAVAEACEQEVDALSTALSLDPRLFAVLAALDVSGEEGATRFLHQRTLRELRRSGVDRDEPTREWVRALRGELVRVGQEFSRNIRDDTRRIAVEPARLAGLPDDFVRAHPPGADGLVSLTTDNVDYLPVVTYAEDGALREELWRLYRQRGHPANEPVLARLLALRHELARLLGYPSWAAYATEDKMVESDGAVAALVDRVTALSTARTLHDLAELVDVARSSSAAPAGESSVPAWDVPWLQERVRATRYGVDAREARPYFEYGRVKEGVLALVARLLGVRFERLSGAVAWHPEVEVYEVRDASGAGAPDRLLGIVYLDMHPREGKYKHYAQFTLVSGVAGKQLPEGVLVCNFPRPGATPALLEHGEVKTFLHELGHLLHHVLGGHVRWAGQSGVATEWDFVEAPSQMLEEWAWDPEVLAGFARHVDTGEPIPTRLVARMRVADDFGKGLQTRQQMFYAALSLELHRRDPAGLDPGRLAAELQEQYTPFRPVPGTFFHLSFGHLEGYSALYYTYMWSLVIAKDLFEEFRRHGLFDRATAVRYRREVLEPGGSKPAAELVRAFLGRDFGFEAFERWLGGLLSPPCPPPSGRGG